MKLLVRIFVFLGLGTIITSYFFLEPKRRFYYAFEEKIYLEEVGDKLIVQFSDDKAFNRESLFSKFPLLEEKEISQRDENTYILSNFNADRGEVLSLLSEPGEVMTIHSIYTTREGSDLGFTDRFIVELKPGYSKKEFEKFNQNNGVEVFKETEDFYVLKVSKEVDVLETANMYFETGNFVFSHPDFYEDIFLSQVPNDPFFVNQFFLHNTGQVIADGRFGA